MGIKDGAKLLRALQALFPGCFRSEQEMQQDKYRHRGLVIDIGAKFITRTQSADMAESTVGNFVDFWASLLAGQFREESTLLAWDAERNRTTRERAERIVVVLADDNEYTSNAKRMEQSYRATHSAPPSSVESSQLTAEDMPAYRALQQEVARFRDKWQAYTDDELLATRMAVLRDPSVDYRSNRKLRAHLTKLINRKLADRVVKEMKDDQLLVIQDASGHAIYAAGTATPLKDCLRPRRGEADQTAMYWIHALRQWPATGDFRIDMRDHDLMVLSQLAFRLRVGLQGTPLYNVYVTWDMAVSKADEAAAEFAEDTAAAAADDGRLPNPPVKRVRSSLGTSQDVASGGDDGQRKSRAGLTRRVYIDTNQLVACIHEYMRNQSGVAMARDTALATFWCLVFLATGTDFSGGKGKDDPTFSKVPFMTVDNVIPSYIAYCKANTGKVDKLMLCETQAVACKCAGEDDDMPVPGHTVVRVRIDVPAIRDFIRFMMSNGDARRKREMGKILEDANRLGGLCARTRWTLSEWFNAALPPSHFTPLDPMAEHKIGGGEAPPASMHGFARIAASVIEEDEGEDDTGGGIVLVAASVTAGVSMQRKTRTADRYMFTDAVSAERLGDFV